MNCPSCSQENSEAATYCDSCGYQFATPEVRAIVTDDEWVRSSGFVGRQREMGELKAALDDALSGHGRLVMLSGAPGIGKTRTAQELTHIANAAGARVLWGNCYEGEGAPPYWPWIQVLRAYLRGSDTTLVSADMGPGAADIAEIAPEVREAISDLGAPPPLGPEQARFRLFDSVTSFLKKSARRQALVIVLDNLHRADQPSLLLLEFLAQEIADSLLLVLGTYRDVEVTARHPLSRSLGELTRQLSFQRLPLLGLGEAEVADFISSRFGFASPPSLVQAAHAKTEGNPLFMTEVTRLFLQEGLTEGQAREQVAWNIRIPVSVQEAIGARLERLSEPCLHALMVASVIGREFGLDLLENLMDQISRDQLLEVLEEALEKRVIEEHAITVGRYQFTHVLVRDTLVSQQSRTMVARQHGRIGCALEELYANEIEHHAAELAHHFAQAVPVLGPEKVVHYSQLAGEDALATYAWEEAEVHFRRALEGKRVSLSGSEPATDGETAELLFGLGRAQVGILPLYRVREAVATLNRAFNYYADALDVDRALAVVRYPIMGLGIGRRSGRVPMIERAMVLMPPDSQAEGRLLSDYGLALGIQEGDDNGAQTALNRALTIARHQGDAALEMRTLCNAARVDRHQGRIQESLDKSRLALELAPRTDDPAAKVDAHHLAGNALICLGNPEAARHHASGMSVPAEKAGDRFSTSNVLLINMRLSMLVGNWVEAREFGDRALAAAPLDARLLLHRIMLEYQEGDVVQGTAYVERLREVMHITSPGPNLDTVYSALVLSLGAWIKGTGELLDEANKAAEVALSSPFATHSVTIWATCAQAIVSVLRGDAAAAVEQYTVLKSDSGRILMDSTIVVDRVIGLLAQTMGNLDQAAAHFEDALDFCRQAGYRPEVAWTCHDYADTLLQRNSSADRARAMSLLAESLSICQELGMRPLMQRVVSLQDRPGSPPVKAPAYPNGLTQREVEVLRLLSAGKTDREIAEELFVSVRTVGGHVSNILKKTNSANRTEAAAYAALHGLISR
ncbi:MAG: helix-turn-helix transcriptional regulator [Dehalococcoidia bacterium]